MKYLHDDGLAEITARLTDCSIKPSRIVQGRLEVFTMKRTASDKRYVLKNLKPETNSNDDEPIPKPNRARSKSVPEDPTSTPPRNRVRRAISVDETSEENDYFHRRLLTDLILTLNLSFCDFDFGGSSAKDFARHQMRTVVSRINRRLGELGPLFLCQMWSRIDSVIKLSRVSVYTFVDTEAIPNALLGGENCDNLWSFNYFFVNRAEKRILLFTCLETLGDKRREALSQSEFSAGSQSASYLNPSVDDETESSVNFDLDPAESISAPVQVHSA